MIDSPEVDVARGGRHVGSELMLLFSRVEFLSVCKMHACTYGTVTTRVMINYLIASNIDQSQITAQPTVSVYLGPCMLGKTHRVCS